MSGGPSSGRGVSCRYRGRCRPGTGAASEKCQAGTGATVLGWPLTCCFVEAARRIELLYRALQEDPDGGPHRR